MSPQRQGRCGQGKVYLGAWLTIRAQARRHRVVYATARADLLGLEAVGLLEKSRAGKAFVFRPGPDLAARPTAGR